MSNKDKYQKHVAEMEVYLKKSKESFLKRWNCNVIANSTLDAFELIKVLGSGAFGTVYLVNTNLPAKKNCLSCLY